MNEINLKFQTGGRYRPIVRRRDGSIVKDHGWQENLILPAGFSGSRCFAQHTQYCHVGTGSTPNKVVLDGTFSQSGTTVTRATGTGVFTSGNINDFIKFETGERAKIVAFTNSLTVEVDRAQSVAAAALTVYDTSRTILDSWVRQISSTTAPGMAQNTDAGTTTLTKVYNFDFETAAKIYNELGISAGSGSTATLFSRIVLDSPVAVDADQFLQIEFKLTCVVGNYRTPAPIDVNIAGWPKPYNIIGITATGTHFDVELDEAHHYATGRPIIITGALPPKTAISSISATASDFTIHAEAHGKGAGQSITIENATPSAYNGVWTVSDATPDTITVASGINPGAGSGGTVRLSTPDPWYDGEWTIASFPAANIIRVASGITPGDAGPSGNVTNSTAATCGISGFGFGSGPTSGTYGTVAPGALDIGVRSTLYLYSEAQMKTPVYGVSTSWNGGVTGTNNSSSGSYDSETRTLTRTFIFNSATANANIRQMAWIGNDYTAGRAGLGGDAAIVVTFDERQIKQVGYQLSVEMKISWEPVLN